MHLPGIFNLILIVLVIMIFFGAGKLPNVMSEIGKGIRNFREGMRENEEQTPQPKASVDPALLPHAETERKTPASDPRKDDAAV